MSRSSQRRKKLRSKLRQQGIDAILVTDERNVTYLSGFSGDSSFLLITSTNTIIISDFRYLQEIADECSDIDSVIRSSTDSMVDVSAKLIRKAGVSSVALEGDSIALALAEKITAAIPQVNTVTTSAMVEKLREIKDPDEVTYLFEKPCMQPNVLFRSLPRPSHHRKQKNKSHFNLEHQIRQFGGRGTSFDPIVAVGSQAALPHAQPSLQRIEQADFVLIDWGADYDRYLSDITRTLVTGKVTKEISKNLQYRAQSPTKSHQSD